jgi:hypothetical protein
MQPTLTSVITDWRTRDESALPDVAPGGEYTRVIASQKFVVLHRILTAGPVLVGLRIGEVGDVPFELVSVDGDVRHYQPKVDQEPIKGQLAKGGAAAASAITIAIPPRMHVCLQLRNEGAVPIKPRTALIVQEENL